MLHPYSIFFKAMWDDGAPRIDDVAPRPRPRPRRLRRLLETLRPRRSPAPRGGAGTAPAATDTVL